MRYVVALIAALLLNASANLLMKAGAQIVQSAGGILRNGVWAAAVTVLSSGRLMVGLACFALNAVFYIYALQSDTLKISIAYPIMVGGGFAVIAIVAHFYMGESLTTGQKLGVALVLAGVVIIAAGSKGQAHPLEV